MSFYSGFRLFSLLLILFLFIHSLHHTSISYIHKCIIHWKRMKNSWISHKQSILSFLSWIQWTYININHSFIGVSDMDILLTIENVISGMGMKIREFEYLSSLFSLISFIHSHILSLLSLMSSYLTDLVIILGKIKI